MHFSPVVSDIGRSSTAETTPIGTPKGVGPAHLRRADKDTDNFFSWHRQTTDEFAGKTSSYIDSALLESEIQDSTFPLFADPVGGHDMMAGVSAPIDIATSLQNGSISPRTQQTSNLTSALQSTSGNETRPTPAMNISNGTAKGMGDGPRRDSVTGGGFGSQFGSGAQPISMERANRKNSRRESIASSLVGGMSWGGVSVSSWVRDE